MLRDKLDEAAKIAVALGSAHDNRAFALKCARIALESLPCADAEHFGKPCNLKGNADVLCRRCARLASLDGKKG